MSILLQLDDAALDVLADKIAEQLRHDTGSPWLSFGELADYTGIPERRLGELVAQGRLVSHTPTRIFHRAEVYDGLDAIHEYRGRVPRWNPPPPPRRTVLVGRRAHISSRTRLAIYARDGYSCVECGAGEPLSLDHIFPWSRGGSDDPANLQTLCGPCNSRKSNTVR